MKKLPLLLFTALLLGLCSCTTRRASGRIEEQEAFRLVTPKLDRDGMLLVFFSKTELKRSFSRLYSACCNSLWHSEMSEKHRIDHQEALLSGKLLWELSGLEKSAGAGFSSKSLNPDGKIIHNRFFLAMDSEQSGLINELLGRNNSIDVAGTVGSLPSTTVFHASFYLNPEMLSTALKRCGRTGENLILDLGSSGFFELFNLLKGVWSITVLDNKNNLPPVKIELPDEKGTVFELLKENFSAKENRGDKSIKFNLPPLQNVIAQREKNNTVTAFYFNDGSAKLFADAKKKPLSQYHLFPDLIKALPERSAGVVYRSGEFDLAAEFFDLKNPAGTLSCAALSRESDGWLLVANGSSSFGEDILFTFSALLKQLIPANFPPEEEAKNPPEKNDLSCSTSKKMEVLSKVLDDYYLKHGKLPEKSGLSGLKELFSPGKIPADFLIDPALPADKITGKDCRFIYFYVSAPPGTDYPVIISNCPEHDDMFLVRFRNGEIKTFTLERSKSMLRKIGFLHTVKKFDESVFMELTRQAADFDKNLQSN